MASVDIPNALPLLQPPTVAMIPVVTTVRKVYDEILISSSPSSQGGSTVNTIGMSVMVQHFTDRVWLCVNEVALLADGSPEGGASNRMRPGTIIVGAPAPMVMGGGSGGGGADDAFLSSPDELEVVMGDRDDPLTNVLSTHIFHLIAEIAPGKGMCLCMSTRRLMRSLKTADDRKRAIDHIMGLVMSAMEMGV